MMKSARFFAFASVLSGALVVACATMQAMTPPKPTSPKQAFILATYEATAVLGAANDSFEMKLISQDVHAKILGGVTEARKALTVADTALVAGDLTTAEGQLAAANAALVTMRLLLSGGAQ